MHGCCFNFVCLHTATDVRVPFHGSSLTCPVQCLIDDCHDPIVVSQIDQFDPRRIEPPLVHQTDPSDLIPVLFRDQVIRQTISSKSQFPKISIDVNDQSNTPNHLGKQWLVIMIRSEPWWTLLFGYGITRTRATTASSDCLP